MVYLHRHGLKYACLKRLVVRLNYIHIEREIGYVQINNWK